MTLVIQLTRQALLASVKVPMTGILPPHGAVGVWPCAVGFK
jgi:hypothetical protein